MQRGPHFAFSVLSHDKICGTAFMYDPPVHTNTLRLMLPAGAVSSGSHSDSIVQGGAYDGALGVIGAIAAVQVSTSPAPSAGASCRNAC